MILNLIIINLCIVYAYDIVNFPRNLMSNGLSIILHRYISPNLIKLPKVLECSLCATMWSSLIYLCIAYVNSFDSFMVAAGFACLNSYLTTYTNYLINLSNKLIITLLTLIERCADKVKNSNILK